MLGGDSPSTMTVDRIDGQTVYATVQLDPATRATITLRRISDDTIELTSSALPGEQTILTRATCDMSTGNQCLVVPQSWK